MAPDEGPRGVVRKPDFAKCMRELVDKHYPHAARIRVVLDNLSTHSPRALLETARSLARRKRHRAIGRCVGESSIATRVASNEGLEGDRRDGATIVSPTDHGRWSTAEHGDHSLTPRGCQKSLW